VTDRNFTQTGNYTFGLNKLNPPAGAPTIAYGNTVNGTHDPVAEIDTYLFAGTTSDSIRVQVNGAFPLSVSVRRPDGTPVCSGSNSGGNLQVNCVLDRTGNHSILITDRDFNQ